jgi:hypothetical protein
MSAQPVSRLQLIPTPDTAFGSGVDERPPLIRLCAGQPVLLSPADVNLIAFANSEWDGLSTDVDPDDYSPAEVALDWFHSSIGVDRRAKGDRAVDVCSEMRRYIIPFMIELARSVPAGRRGIGGLRFQQAQELQRILAGDHALPAATVAGDLLGRLAINCLWLPIKDAAAVCHGGENALQSALADSCRVDGAALAAGQNGCRKGQR